MSRRAKSDCKQISLALIERLSSIKRVVESCVFADTLAADGSTVKDAFAECIFNKNLIIKVTELKRHIHSRLFVPDPKLQTRTILRLKRALTVGSWRSSRATSQCSRKVRNCAKDESFTNSCTSLRLSNLIECTEAACKFDATLMQIMMMLLSLPTMSPLETMGTQILRPSEHKHCSLGATFVHSFIALPKMVIEAFLSSLPLLWSWSWSTSELPKRSPIVECWVPFYRFPAAWPLLWPPATG